MTKGEIEKILMSNANPYSTAYTRAIKVSFRGDGKNCWELGFPLFSGETEKVWFYPSARDAKGNADRLADLANSYIINYYNEASKQQRGGEETE